MHKISCIKLPIPSHPPLFCNHKASNCRFSDSSSSSKKEKLNHNSDKRQDRRKANVSDAETQ